MKIKEKSLIKKKGQQKKIMYSEQGNDDLLTTGPDYDIPFVVDTTYTAAPSNTKSTLFEGTCKLFHFCTEDTYGGETRHNYWKERAKGNATLSMNHTTNRLQIKVIEGGTMVERLSSVLTSDLILKRLDGKKFTFACYDTSNSTPAKMVQNLIVLANEDSGEHFAQVWQKHCNPTMAKK